MPKPRKRKCLHCREFFRPDHRNVNKQKYCTKKQCRKASKAASQKKWLEKEENANYFKGAENVSRVQEWRKRNPDYGKKQKALQDHSISEKMENQDVSSRFTNEALQDLFNAHHAVFLGLLAQLSGSPLQDDIVITGRRLQQLGQDILASPHPNSGGRYDNQKTPSCSPHGSSGSRTVQLG